MNELCHAFVTLCLSLKSSLASTIIFRYDLMQEDYHE